MFLRTYQFIAVVPSHENPHHIFFESFLWGYVLHIVYDFSFGALLFGAIRSLGFLGVCILTGYLLAIFLRSKFFKKILRTLRITRTPFYFLWDDLRDDRHPIWITAISYDFNVQYTGLLALKEDCTRFPLLVLSRYEKKTLDGKEIVCWESLGEQVVIDTNKFDIIELTYAPDSSHSQESSHGSQKKK